MEEVEHLESVTNEKMAMTILIIKIIYNNNRTYNQINIHKKIKTEANFNWRYFV